MDLDIELALLKVTGDKFKEIDAILPKEYYLIDKSDKNWGLVIRKKIEVTNDLNTEVDSFLSPLIEMSSLFSENKAVLRMGVFYTTATCTLRINVCDIINKMGISLELSMYPSDSD